MPSKNMMCFNEWIGKELRLFYNDKEECCYCIFKGYNEHGIFVSFDDYITFITYERINEIDDLKGD